jgi:arsenate reductase
MNVSEVARRTGLSPSGVRWYEAAGVLPAAPRRDNGYRDYSDEDLARLRMVVALRRLGFAPADAGRLATWCLERGEVNPEVTALLEQHREAVARRRDELNRLEAEMEDLAETLAAVRRAGEQGAEEAGGAISVLFHCRGNSGRSQIGEALLGHLGGRAFDVRSAGTEPRPVSALAVAALKEAGIDWSGARSKSAAEFRGQRFDYVITLSALQRDACPELPGSTNTLHWHLDDPAEAEGNEEERLAAYRRTQEELSARLRPFIEVALRTAGRFQGPPPGTKQSRR